MYNMKREKTSPLLVHALYCKAILKYTQKNTFLQSLTIIDISISGFNMKDEDRLNRRKFEN